MMFLVTFIKDCLVTSHRATLVIHVLSLGSKAEPNLYHMTISLRMRVSVYHLFLKALTYC